MISGWEGIQGALGEEAVFEIEEETVVLEDCVELQTGQNLGYGVVSQMVHGISIAAGGMMHL